MDLPDFHENKRERDAMVVDEAEGMRAPKRRRRVGEEQLRREDTLASSPSRPPASAGDSRGDSSDRAALKSLESTKRGATGAVDRCPRSVSSVEAMIAVPLEFILREVGPQQQQQHQHQGRSQRKSKPLLSRAEAQVFLNVGMLAHAMDSLVASSAVVLEKRHRYNSYRENRLLDDGTGTGTRRIDPRLLPLGTLLHTLGRYVPDQALSRLNDELESVMSQLRASADKLRQFSEQNWQTSERFLDAAIDDSGEGGASTSWGSVVAMDSRRLSDVQDELCNRIDKLLSVNVDGLGIIETGTESEESSLPIKVYCELVMSRAPPSLPPPSASQSSELSQSQSQYHTVDDRNNAENDNNEMGEEKDGTQKSAVEEGKENAPSQQRLQHQQESPAPQATSPLPASPMGSESQTSCSSAAFAAGGMTQAAAEVLTGLANSASAATSSGGGSGLDDVASPPAF